jgi:hypothetical protein
MLVTGCIWPFLERQPYQRRLSNAGRMRLPCPASPASRSFFFVRKFDFRNDQAQIFVLEDVDFPNEPLTRKLVTKFLGRSSSRKPSRTAPSVRNGIFKLEAANLGDRGLERKRCPCSIDKADTKGDGAVARQIAWRMDMGSPADARHLSSRTRNCRSIS